ncbi:DUF1015 family protein, partial [Candidatus Aerophobetes bacterium]|nr:DUF1015 family protein [Candidatus Aerophobetes bacterium]
SPLLTFSTASKLLVVKWIFINIHFTTSSFEAVEKVNKGEFQIAFFLPPTKVEEVKNVALAGKKMPPKSTYFYPKLLSGLLIRDLEDAVKSGI